MPTLVTSVTAGTLAAVIAISTGLALLTGSLGSGCPTAASASTAASTPGAPTSSAPAGGRQTWDDEQLTNARTIIAVGTQLGVPARGKVIALATAIQESSLRNLAGRDADSVGLFQQRPSAGWGTPRQLHTPTYAAERFYRALLAVPGWQTLPVTLAAQAVQRSALPTAYADDEPAAIQLLTSTSGAAALAASPAPSACDGLFGAGQPAGDASSGATSTGSATVGVHASPAARQAIIWAMAQLGTPYSYGGDCTDAHSGQAAHRCDCSSLTQRAWASAGVTLPRTAAAQFRTGRPIPMDQIQPGDLLFGAGADGTPFSGGPGCESMIDTSVCAAQTAAPSPSVSAAGVVDGGLAPRQKCAAARVILFAASQLGKPYRWGATGPDAFDCSGLSMMAYRSAGIAVPRTSQQQYAAGPYVPPGKEQPGDLVFFAGSDGTTRAPGHVGVALGGGLMIDAPYTGARVRVDTIVGDVGFTRPSAGR